MAIHDPIEDGKERYIEDQWKRKYRFKVSSFFVPTGLASMAVEVTEDGVPGYEFQILSDHDMEPQLAEEELMKKVRRGLNRRHLKTESGKLIIGAKGVLRGAIAYNDDFSDTKFDRNFVIDGKRITMEKFNELLQEYEGWNFKLQIVDPSDDL